MKIYIMKKETEEKKKKRREEYKNLKESKNKRITE